MKKIINLYKNAYSGLSPAAWMLSLVMLINRSGSMVMPFLSIYLVNELGFDLKKAGIILGTFGLGAMAGSFLGGWLTDKVGHFKVQFFSLTLGGIMFFIIPYIQTYELLTVFIFIASMVVESLRPANATSVALYAKPENITRAFSLNRMAINLGFSVGPAIGGILAAYSYYWLFLVDGTTCIMAGILFFFYFRNKQPNIDVAHPSETGHQSLAQSAWQDVRFILFCICVILFASSFFQLFFTLPLYYREVYQLSEVHIGLLLGLNGMVVFLFEMILIYLIGEKIRGKTLIIFGVLLAGISFIILNIFSAPIILYLAVFIISFGEIFAMPYMITFTTERANHKNQGAYMGMYSLTYATAFVIAPLMGTRILANYNFQTLWWVISALTVVSALGFYFIVKPKSLPAPRLAEIAEPLLLQ